VRRVVLIVACIVLGFLALGGPCGADVALVGGVKVVSGADVDAYLETRGGVTHISFPGTLQWPLDGSPADYHAMPPARVEEAIRAIEYPIRDLEIQVVILPVPRLHVPESSAEGRVIFLSPGRGEYPNEHIHYIVAHEIGHVVQHLLMPESCRDLWDRFAALRGLDLGDTDASADHAYRPAEIFAEDFRVLFGGDMARCGGSIENHNLEEPEGIQGLRDFMLALLGEWEACVRISAYPNPFSSDVVFEAFTLGEQSGPVEVTVFDALGRKVRALGRPQDGSVYIVWDGREEGGRMVAPGVYFAHISAGEDLRIRKLIKR